MPDGPYLLAVVVVCALITWVLRALPFAVLAPLRSSALVHHLGEHMPVGVMIALVGYTVRDVPWLDWAVAGPVVLAAGVTVALQWWRRNLLVSLGVGTVLHVVLATLLAAG